MSLMDTADGAFMSQAYGWAFSNPIRKVYYNITVTSLSVAVALLIGTIELLQVMAAKFSLDGGFWAFLDELDFGRIGYVVVGLFVADLGVLASCSGRRGGSRSAGARWSSRRRRLGRSARRGGAVHQRRAARAGRRVRVHCCDLGSGKLTMASARSRGPEPWRFSTPFADHVF